MPCFPRYLTEGHISGHRKKERIRMPSSMRMLFTEVFEKGASKAMDEGNSRLTSDKSHI